MDREPEIYPGIGECDPNTHRFFALEHIGDEASKTVRIPLVCTACGTLVVHTVQISKK